MVGYLTPDSVPAGVRCRTLKIPDDEAWIAIVTGALNALVEPNNWQKFGTLTPAEAAAALVDMFDGFSFDNDGVCRVIGEVIAYAGSAAPSSKWLLCDGSSVLRSAYPDLFGVCGSTYGAVDGSHFNLPDCRGRTILGAGAGSGLTNRALGSTVGTEQHTLAIGEIPSHTHNYFLYTTGGVYAPGAVPALTLAGVFTPTGAAGGGGAHNNMQPSIALNYYIRALP